MKKLLFVLTSALVSYIALAADPWFYDGADYAKLIPNKGFRFNNSTEVITSPNNPTLTSTTAAVGSLLIRTGTAELYQKTGAGGTAWTKFDTGSPGAYVLKAGDTMTGSLTIAPAAGNSTLMLNSVTATADSVLRFDKAGLQRGYIVFEDTPSELYIGTMNSADAINFRPGGNYRFGIGDTGVTSTVNFVTPSVNVSGLTASRAVVTDGSKNLASSSISSTDLVTGITTAIAGTTANVGNTLVRRDATTNGFSSGPISVTGNIGVSAGNVNVAGTVITNNLTVNSGSNLQGVNATSITNGDGTAGAPSYSFSSDATTGMFLPVTGSVALSTSGVERLRLDNMYNAALGTSSMQLSSGSTPIGINTLTVYSGNNGGGGLELGSGTGTASATVGRLGWVANTNNVADKTIGYIDMLQGSTAGKRGGTMRFWTKTDNGNGAVRMQLLGNGQMSMTSLGAAGTPDYSFDTDTDTGMYRSAADTINWATGGTSRLSLSSTALTSANQIVAPVGSATTPSLLFSGSSAGLYLDGTNSIVLRGNGTGRVTLSPSGRAIMTIGTMSNTSPVLSLNSTTDGTSTAVGVSYQNTSDLSLVSGGAYSFTARQSGQVEVPGTFLVGTTSNPNAWTTLFAANVNSGANFGIQNTNAGSGAYAFYRFGNDADVNGFIARNSSTNTTYAGAGSLNIGTTGANPFGIVTNNLLRAFWDSAGAFSILGAQNLPYRTVTATGSQLASDNVIYFDATGGSITFNAIDCTTIDQRYLKMKRIDSSGNTVTFDPSGTQQVDGNLTLSIPAGGAREVQCRNPNWWVF